MNSMNAPLLKLRAIRALLPSLFIGPFLRSWILRTPFGTAGAKKKDEEPSTGKENPLPVVVVLHLLLS